MNGKTNVLCVSSHFDRERCFGNQIASRWTNNTAA